MSQIDATDYNSLSTALDQLSNDEINAAVQAQDGGPAKFLDGVFEGMSSALNPAKAGSQQATVQYEITAPDGTHTYAMRIADGRGEVERGAAARGDRRAPGMARPGAQTRLHAGSTVMRTSRSSSARAIISTPRARIGRYSW